jgi:hypothetical protein
MPKPVQKNVQPSKGNKSMPKSVVKVSKQEVAVPAAIQTYFKPVMPKMSTRADGSVTMSGSDLLDFVSLVNDSTGAVLKRLDLNPQSTVFSNTRLGIESLRFEKYRFKKLCFHFLAELPTSQKGSIIMAYDPDAADDPQENFPASSSESLTAIQTFMAYRDAENFNIWLGAKLEAKVKFDPQKFYYTNYSGGDIRLAQQGSLFVVLGGSTGLSGGTTLGKIALEWEIEFYEPTLENVNPQTKAVSNSVNFTSVTAQGFNGLNSGNLTQTQNGPDLGTDSQGNKFFDLIPGVYDVFSTLVTNGSTAGTVTYNLVSNIADNLGTITSLVGAVNTNVLTSLTSQEHRITVPQGGAKLYSTLNAALFSPGWTWKIAKAVSGLVL